MENQDKIFEKLIEIDAGQNVLSVNSDIRSSDLFALIYQDQIRYVPQRKCWYHYDGKRWQKDEGDMIANKLCKTLAGNLKKYANMYESDSYVKMAQKWQKRSYRDMILKDARDVCMVYLNEFDKNKHLINLNNGTFNLKTGLLEKHNPDDFITKLAPVDFDSAVCNERWESFIDEIMCGDKEKALFLQKVLGYSIGGTTQHECLFVLYGESTRNGKGTLMESVLNVLGDYGRTVKPESIAQSTKSSNSPNEDIARLKGIRLANISEPQKNMPLNSALVKTLTGGDTINARFLHENSFDFKPQFKIYINTNYLPSVDDMTVFNSGRIHLIPFERHFTISEQDKTLKEFFRGEELKTTIFNWLICGYYQSLTDLNPPKSVVDATEKYKMNSDEVYKFLNTVLTPNPVGKIIVIDAYKLYTDWCYGNGHAPIIQAQFSKRANNFSQVKTAKISGRSYRCIIGYDKKVT